MAELFSKVERWVWRCPVFVAAAVICLAIGTPAAGDGQKVYVGPEVCMECHTDQYESYHAFSKKAHSYQSVARMEKKVTADELRACYKCHTTGYGEPGGFVSLAETPQLKNNSCESCHGPGSVHAETEDPEDVKGTLEVADCEACHSTDRVDAFKFKPLLFGGAH
jgi:hypothetical protein